MVFTNSQHLPARCVINAISILTYFLSCPSIELSNTLYNTSLSISKAICKNVTGNNIIDPHVVDIASNLSSSLLRYNLFLINQWRKLGCHNYERHNTMNPKIFFLKAVPSRLENTVIMYIYLPLII